MPLERPRTQEVFEQVYDALVMYAGAQESGREDFIHHMLRCVEISLYETREYRFQGALGGGGKFWLSPECFRVSAYEEDYSVERVGMLSAVNEALAKLFVPPERCRECEYERRTSNPHPGPHGCDPTNEENRV